ncbi:MAG: flagellar hook protein, partial [Methylophilaceae bacterium 17-44-8]
DGKLALDSTKLSTAVANHFDDIAALFSTSAKATDAQITYLGNTSKTQSGTYPITVSQIGSDITNMVGTMNGVAGNGLNQELIGATGDASEGLRIKVTGGSTGARGTVTFVKGYAAQLDDILDGLLDDDGILAARTDGISSSVKRLERQTDAFNLKLTVIEKRYREQYTRLDTLLSSLQNTSSYLSQQISALSNN